MFLIVNDKIKIMFCKVCNIYRSKICKNYVNIFIILGEGKGKLIIIVLFIM